MARGLLDVDGVMQRARTDVSAANDVHTTAHAARAAAKAEFEKAAEALVLEQVKRGESESLHENRAALKRHSDTLVSAETKKTEKDDAARKEREAIALFETAERTQAALAKERSDTAARLKTAEAAAEQRAILSTSALEVKSWLDAACAYNGALKAVNDAQGHVARAHEEHGKNLRAYEAAQQNFDAAEAALAGAQAQHLAEKLRPGEACPVCGSHDHTAPAQGRAESAGRNEAFTAARAALDSARKAEAQSGQTLAAAPATLSEKELLLAGVAKPKNTVAELESRAAKIRGDIDALGPAIDLASLRSALEAAESKLTEAGRAVEDARAKCDQAYRACARNSGA